MAIEIERKFLVSGDGWSKRANRGKIIRQAYLTLNDTISLRIRTIGKAKAYLTIKGGRSGATLVQFRPYFPVLQSPAVQFVSVRRARISRA